MADKNKDDIYEVVNDKSIDAIKDNFTPPGAKIGVDNEFVEYSEKPKALTKDHIEKYGEELLKKLGASDEQIAEAKKEDDYNPQSEVRYTSPEELKLSEMSEEDLKQGLEDIKRGVTDYTDAEEPIVTGWIKDEMAKRKSKPTDEMADFQKSLDDYAKKNKKGRDDIPVTTRR